MSLKDIGKGIRQYLVPLIAFSVAALAALSITSYTSYAGKQTIEKKQQAQIKYNAAYNQMFRFANKDSDCLFSINEQVDAWKRMGYDKVFVESQGAAQFPTPSIGELEKAIESYQAEIVTEKKF